MTLDQSLIQKALERFIKFAESYMKGANSENREAYRLKKDHTVRVYEAAKTIVEQSKNIDIETGTIILLAAILHDVGRFEQWKLTKSYRDTADSNHPEIGATMLENGGIEHFIPKTRKYDKIIIMTVRWHGALNLPENLNERELLVCQIVRDSDRMDIFYQSTIKRDFPILYSQELGNKNLSEGVKKNFEEDKSVEWAHVRTKFDMLALRLALCKQMSTQASKEYIIKKDYVNSMVEFFKKMLTDEKGHFYYNVEELEWLRNNTMEYLMR